MSSNDLRRSVKEELEWDPKIDHRAVAVTARDGAVTLRGTVTTFRQKRDAEHAAERVNGVASVANELNVRLVGFPREDLDLRGDVLQALMLDSAVPGTIDARVDDGWVTLTGKAEWKYQ